jgi:chromosome segregation ATPase
MSFNGNLMRATAVELAAIEAAEQRAESAEAAWEAAELEAQALRGQLAELSRLCSRYEAENRASRRALRDAMEYIKQLEVDTEVLRYLAPESGTMRRLG